MPRLLLAVMIGLLACVSPAAAATAPGEPVLTHSAFDDLENHVGLLGLLGLLGFFGLRGHDRRRG